MRPLPFPSRLNLRNLNCQPRGEFLNLGPGIKKDKSLSRRVFVLIGILTLWALVIAGRLFSLHELQAADFRQLADRQQQQEIEITPQRGVIYDRNGHELAISTKVD